MAIIKTTSTTTYNIDMDTLKSLIAKDLGITDTSMLSITKKEKCISDFDDRYDRYELVGLTVTVHSK